MAIRSTSRAYSTMAAPLSPSANLMSRYTSLSWFVGPRRDYGCDSALLMGREAHKGHLGEAIPSRMASIAAWVRSLTASFWKIEARWFFTVFWEM